MTAVTPEGGRGSPDGSASPLPGTPLIRRADLWAGASAAVFGGLMLAIGADYPTGSGGRIGPGYAPRLLGGLLVGLGVLLVLRAASVQTPVEGLFRPRPVVLVIASVLAFAPVFTAAGLVPAVLVSVLIANFASPENDWRSGVAVGALLALFAWLLFVVALKLPMPVFRL